jgi:hypothetical protein
MIMYNTEDTEFIIATPGIIEAPPYPSHRHPVRSFGKFGVQFDMAPNW